jgi:hypothetical protein
MNKTAQTPPSWRDRLLFELRRNKKKTGVMVALVVVGVLMAGKLLLGGSSPSKAQAKRTSAVAAPGRPSPVVAPGSVGPAPSDESPTHRAPVAVRDAASVRFERDLFLPDPKVFPETGKTVMEKAGVVPKTEREQQIQKIREAGKKLTLTSTMLGRSPCAAISGQILGVGDWIGQFQVVEIDQWSCLLVREGVRVELELKIKKSK